MAQAICLAELNSIAKGIEVADYMIKAAQVEIIRCSTICPGKYVIIVSGDVSDVKIAMKEVEEKSAHYLVDSLLIPNVHEQLIPALTMTNAVEENSAVGVIECFSVATAILAADTAVKAANISLIEIRMGLAIGGKGLVTMCGTVSDVKAAIAAATSQNGLFLNSTIIPRVDPAIFNSLL